MDKHEIFMYTNAVDKTMSISVRDPNKSRFWTQSADGNWIDTLHDNRPYISLGYAKNKSHGIAIKKKLYEAYNDMGYTSIPVTIKEMA